jgi:prophage antirepressor-like protein
VQRDGKVWVVLGDLCDALGINVEGQRKKLREKAWTCSEEIIVQVTSASGVVQNRELFL